jgi:DNA-binding NtrC family response regulator
MKQNVLLFVDDDSHTAWSFGSNLLDHARAQNLSLRVFTDPDAALSFIFEKEPSIWGAIVDLWMCDKTTGVEDVHKGREVINAIRKNHPKARIAVLSAHIDDKAKTEFSRFRALSYKKPASTTEVFEGLLAKAK